MTAYKFNYEGTDYILEFDRKSVKMAEQRLGLTADAFVDTKVPKVTDIENLFHAALLKHHPSIKQDTVERLYDLQDDKQGLLADLMQMYIEVITPMLSDNKSKNSLKREKL